MSNALQRIFTKAIQHNILPIRINFLRTRDFEEARIAAREAAREAFNEGSQLYCMLEELAKSVDKSFAPDPDECRPASYFDAIITNHRNAMNGQAEIVRCAIRAFVDQCHALEALATVLIQSDNGTQLDAVKKLHVFGKDGGDIIEMKKAKNTVGTEASDN